MSTTENNVIPMTQGAAKREPGQRWTAKRIDALKREQFKQGYESGHADGWRERQNSLSNPLIECGVGILIGVVVGVIGANLHFVHGWF